MFSVESLGRVPLFYFTLMREGQNFWRNGNLESVTCNIVVPFQSMGRCLPLLPLRHLLLLFCPGTQSDRWDLDGRMRSIFEVWP